MSSAAQPKDRARFWTKIAGRNGIKAVNRSAALGQNGDSYTDQKQKRQAPFSVMPSQLEQHQDRTKERALLFEHRHRPRWNAQVNTAVGRLLRRNLNHGRKHGEQPKP